MATLGNERELLKSGLEQEGKVRGAWAQNLWENEGTISVRPGWGVAAELDSTLANDLGAGNQAAGSSHIDVIGGGYRKLLGSCLVETNFGHKQIVSVFTGTFFAGNLAVDPRNEQYDQYYAVRIFDLTTDKHWEEILYRYTAEMIGGNKVITDTAAASHPSEWYSTYSTSFSVNNSNFKGSDFDSDWFFHVVRGHVYFGSAASGIYVYRPADFGGYNYQQLQTSNHFDWISGVAESSLVSKVHFTNGIFSDGFIYADQNNINKIVAMTSFRGRIAYATEYEIWFSDVNRPNNVIARNFIAVPSRKQVTAMYEHMGNLIIFTESEMFLYIPSEGTIISQGRPPIKVSESVGCIGQQAIVKNESSLVWVAHSGIYQSSDGRSLQELSQDIRSFWEGNGIMTNPMTSYYEANAGWVNIDTVTPPRTMIEFDPDRVTLAYNHQNKSLVMGCPNINGCWVFSGIWSWWPMESSVTKDALGNPVVSSSQNLTEPWVVADNNNIYAVCGIDISSVADSTTTVVSAVDFTMPAAGVDIPTALAGTSESFVICKLGYGGALDRSSDQEDYRISAGRYLPVIRSNSDFPNGAFYFEKPYLEKDHTTGTEVYWFPVYLVPPNALLLKSYELLFAFDNTEWSADPNASSDIALRYCTERTVSHSASGAVVAKTTDAVAAPSVTGNHIHIVFDGAAAGIPAASWTYQPNLNLTRRRKNAMFEIGLRKLTTNSVNGFGMFPKRSNVSSTSATISSVPIYLWLQHFIGASDSHNNNAKVQAVDWAYKSEELSNGPIQIKARGIYAYLNSRGRGLQTNRIVPNWVWGLYNVILGSDNKDYTSQIVDYDDNIQKIEDKVTIRSRLRNATGNMVTRVFSGDAKWGSTGTPGDGNYLIDDQETDTIATSDSVKGSRISYMVFGFIQDRAESLTIQSLIGVFRPGGKRRRTGR